MPPIEGGFDLFATSLALTPTGETLAVGAPGRTLGGGLAPFELRTYSGGVYVFELINSVQWEEAAILADSSASPAMPGRLISTL